MWICLNDAFISIVTDPNDYTRVQVRARQKKHLENLFINEDVDKDVLETIIRTEERDYQWRVFVNREVMADILANRIRNIYYHNFKDSVTDWKLAKAYTNVWYTMLDIDQPARQTKKQNLMPTSVRTSYTSPL